MAYFKEQGFDLFDALIVLVDIRFTEYDIGIIRSCSSCGIPYFLVRSKSDQHIRNILQSLKDIEDEMQGTKNRREATELEADARNQFIRDTQDNFKSELDKAGLLFGGVYLVSSLKLRSVVKKGAEVKGIIDEWKFVQDVKRRFLDNGQVY